MDRAQAKLLLYRALGEPIGLLLQVSDVGRARQMLYQVRTETGDQDLAGLQLRVSTIPGGNLLIVKETIQVAGSPEPEGEPDAKVPDLSEL